jgi:CHAD domain-containing protein
MQAPAATTIETEWQLDAQDLRLVLRWLESFNGDGAVGVTIASGPTINQVDTYVDTEDRRLDRAGFTVRVRRSRRGPPEATLKSLTEVQPDAPRVRLELAEHLETEDATELARAPGPVGRRVRALVGPRRLVPLFDLHTRRRVFPIAVAGAPSGELLLDETTIREPGGPILSRLRRVEVEVPTTAVAAVEPLVESLKKGCGLQPAVMTKYETALAASGTRRLPPQSFGPTTIGPGDTVGAVALSILRRQLSIFLAKEPGTRLGDDIEELHDMRVASRRMRAAISLFRDTLPADVLRLRPELAWIGQTIGAVRDLDVQLAQVDEWLALLPEADREPLGRLRALLVEEREAARTEMLAALDSPRYDRFVSRFAAVLRTRSGSRTAAALAVAPDLVERRHASLRKAERRARRTAEPEAYHRLRIAGKRFRYALEFLSEVYPGETKQLIRRTVALQDLLGAFQDADVAIARLRELTATRGAELGPETIFAMGEVAERYRSSMQASLAGVPRTFAPLDGKTWKRFRKRLEASRPAAPAARPAPPPRPDPVP